ncbi:class I SAM-dependent RNA methyltransferase [Brachybacterium huguangmaarense]
MEALPPDSPAPSGRMLTLTCQRPAAGGTFVARHEGRVVFVRGAAPDETVIARLLDDPEEAKNARFWRAEAVEVLEPSPDRVPTVWPEAGTEGVGGADWAHIALPAQRRIGSEVLQELLTRAKVRSFPVEDAQVEPASDDEDGLAWRTRVRYAVDPSRRVGMRGWRSHDVRPVGHDPIAVREISQLDIPSWAAPEGTEAIDAIGPSDGPPAIVIVGRDLDQASIEIPARWDGADVSVQNASGLHPLRGDGLVRERVGDRVFEVSQTGFWQSHRLAPQLLTDVVDADLDVHDGDVVWDLYGGVGLFAARAAQAAGPGSEVVSVEGSARASALAATNLADLPGARAEHAECVAWVREAVAAGARPDRVVLDPPRAGAGQELMRLLASAVTSRIVYVSCEPSTLARDLAAIEEKGWRVTDLRAFDLYPHTHHIESVAILEPAP